MGVRVESLTLPVPTDDAYIKMCAMSALAYNRPMDEMLALENTPDSVLYVNPTTPNTDHDFVRAFRCLSLWNQKFGPDRVERLRAEFEALSFLDKVRIAGFGVGGGVNIRIINGQLVYRPPNLLMYGYAQDDDGRLGIHEWVKTLSHPYMALGNSVLVITGCVHLCESIVRLGAEAIIVRDYSGQHSSLMADHFKRLQEKLQEELNRSVPLFVYDPHDPSRESLDYVLRKFFDEHFPKRALE